MEFTPIQEVKLRQLSDTQLYRDAEKFIEKQGTIKNSQISGLENIVESADGFSKVVAFINHQAEKKGSYFFSALKGVFVKLKKDVESDQDFIPDNLTKKQLKEYIEFFGLLIAREFIHHLAAEHRFRSEE